jgi:pimeloyl-ACP methyl ester carboxylesterase
MGIADFSRRLRLGDVELACRITGQGRITHLILADVGAGADDAWRLDWLARRWVDFAERTGWDELLPDMLRSELFKFYANRRPLFRRHMAALIRATPLVGLRHTLTQVLGRRRSFFRMRHALQAVKVPTLIMLGQHDYICRNAARLLSENIPGAVLHRIEGAGHMSPLERPDQFSDTLTAFLART